MSYLDLAATSPSTSKDSDSVPPCNARAQRRRTRRTTRPTQDFRSGWQETTTFHRQPLKFTGETGPRGDFGGFTPLQIFQLFWSQAVWDMMVCETNRYAQQSIDTNPQLQSSWTPTTVAEMMAFVALLLAMGINSMPQYSMYWCTSELLRIPLYPAVMARNRFTSILRFLHLSDNKIPQPKGSQRDKLLKVRPLLDLVLPTFLTVYSPGQNLSPDECMIRFKGRLAFKQYMPRKPIKWGMKCFSLNESQTGYTCAWQLYTGADVNRPTNDNASTSDSSNFHPPILTVAGQVVMDLVKEVQHKGHIIFCDNWYTSPALVCKLSQLGFGFCGTSRYTTLGMPHDSNPKKYTMRKGDDPRFLEKADQLCVVWQDKKRVNLLTTIGDCSLTTKKIRCSKSETGFRDINKPSSVETYNKNMGGTDLAGQCFQYYTHKHRSMKWWKRVLFNMLDICLLNATVVFNSIASNQKMSTLEFRISVIEGLLLGWKRSTTQRGQRHSKINIAAGGIDQAHYPGKNPSGKKRDCVVCSNRRLPNRRKQTRIICKQCNEPMCVIPCFEKFHKASK